MNPDSITVPKILKADESVVETSHRFNEKQPTRTVVVKLFP